MGKRAKTKEETTAAADSETAPEVESNEQPSEADAGPSGDESTRMTVRLKASERERLEAAAEKYRRDTGSNETATGLAQTFILNGLALFERRGTISIGG